MSTNKLLLFLLECQRQAIKQGNAEVTAQITELIADLIAKEIINA